MIIALLIPIILLTAFSLANLAVVVFAGIRWLRPGTARINALALANATSIVLNALIIYGMFFHPVMKMTDAPEHRYRPIFNGTAILTLGWLQVVVGLIAALCLIRYSSSMYRSGPSRAMFLMVTVFLFAHVLAILSVAILLLV